MMQGRKLSYLIKVDYVFKIFMSKKTVNHKYFEDFSDFMKSGKTIDNFLRTHPTNNVEFSETLKTFDNKMTETLIKAVESYNEEVDDHRDQVFAKPVADSVVEDLAAASAPAPARPAPASAAPAASPAASPAPAPAPARPAPARPAPASAEDLARLARLAGLGRATGRGVNPNSKITSQYQENGSLRSIMTSKLRRTNSNKEK
jgi:hypothetical protein